ncbi:MAG: SiaB family protein kinase [Bacteroidales bacterium]|nr:SiaB family protein kinase [Bacteroidales bacterium]
MNESLGYIYDQFVDVEKDDFQYIYRGEITPILIMNVLDFAKSNLAKAVDTKNLKNRIYYIMGEGLQNITRHQVDNSKGNIDDSAIVFIHKKMNKYYIVTGNLMRRSEENSLKEKIDYINKLSPEELNEYCRDIRLVPGFNERGGGSLGLIEMAKRSGNKLSYLMVPINEEKSYFYLSIEILTQIEKQQQYEYSLKDVINTHNFIKENNFILSFKGDFNQDNLLSLLSILKNGMSDSKTRIKLYSVMVELLQNIVKHADNIDNNKDWKAGVFYICENKEKFSLLAGNYILNIHSEDLAKRFDRINALDSKELTKEYNKILFNFNDNSPISTGLGIIDIRRKCGEKVEYYIKKVNNTIDFLTVKVDINKID